MRGGGIQSVNALYQPNLEDLTGLLSVPPHHTTERQGQGCAFFPAPDF